MKEHSIKTKATPKTTLVIMLLELFVLETTKFSFMRVVPNSSDVPLKLYFSLGMNGKVSKKQCLCERRTRTGLCTKNTALKILYPPYVAYLIAPAIYTFMHEGSPSTQTL